MTPDPSSAKPDPTLPLSALLIYSIGVVTATWAGSVGALTMRILYSFAAGFFILLALIALLRYDLTKAKCEEIKAELDRRRSAIL